MKHGIMLVGTKLAETKFAQISLVLISGICIGLGVIKGFGFMFIGFYFGVAYFTLSLFRPLQALLLFVLLFPLFSTFNVSLGRGIPDLSFNRMCVLTLAVAVLLRAYFGKTNLKGRSYAELWMLVFCLLTTASMLLNDDREQFMQNTLFFMDSFLIPFVVFFLAKNLFSKQEDVIQLTKVLVILSAYLSLMAIYETFTWHDLFTATYAPDAPESVYGLRLSEETGILRANGPFQYPETFGVVSAMIFLMLSYHLGPRNHGSKRHPLANWICIFILPLLLVGLYFNMFRTIWMGLIVGLIIRLGIFKTQRWKLITFCILVSVIAWLSFDLLKSTNVYRERLTNVKSFYGRIATFKSGLAMFADHPKMMGVGYNSYTDTYIRYNYERTFRGAESRPWAHNSYLKICVENGILGFMAFIFIIGFLFLYIIRLFRLGGGHEIKRISATYLGVLLVYLISSFFLTIGHYSNVNILFYFLMGTLVAQASNYQFITATIHREETS